MNDSPTSLKALGIAAANENKLSRTASGHWRGKDGTRVEAETVHGLVKGGKMKFTAEKVIAGRVVHTEAEIV